nr:PAS domain-containing sensor histidine kinase [Candidatus Sigynarchaeota archaeon]
MVIDKTAEARLARSEKIFRHLFESSPNAILLIDNKGVITECNIWTQYLSGYDRKEIVGKRFVDLPFLTPASLKVILENYQKIQQSSNGMLEAPIDVEIINKDGRSFWVSLMGSVLNLPDGPVLQVIGTNITERKKLQSMLEEENKRLKNLDDLRKYFVINATHELKTPLASIDGASQFLAENYDALDDNTARKLVNLIQGGSTRLKEIIENLLDFSRIESGNLNVKSQQDDLVPVLQEAVKITSYQANQRKQKIDTQFPETLIVNFDKVHIEQVLVNLITNAIKNTPQNGSVRVKASRYDDAVRVEVIDNGIGITSEEMPQLFTKFGKIERHDLDVEINIQGSGLGLYLSQEIIERHGGKIWAESEGRKKGSTFIFTLPINTKHA